jgi:two-component system nitrogen regulation response regulator GlnG
MPSLLVVDDDALTLGCFRLLFPKGKVTVQSAGTAGEGLELFAAHRPDVVVLDVKLPDISGLDAFRRFRDIDAKVPIILMTGHGTAQTAIEAMRLGAYDYVVKPSDPETLRQLIGRAFEISRLMRVPAKVAVAENPDDNADMLVGNCPAMQEVYKAIGRVASQDVTVLIRGESGTGKELVARAIYHYSKRTEQPFLAVNCAAIPETLLESELFGHEKGAFTGADRKRIGKFEQCDKGTLFLDEIGDMTPFTQAKILRVLQDRVIERVGGNDRVSTDVRIIAATNRELEKMIAAGQFRSDLYYRLNVYSIHLPPLRERGEDVGTLAQHFVARANRELGKDVQSIAPESLELLRRYPWPGNVREMQSALQQAVLHATGPNLIPEFLPSALQNPMAPVPDGGGERPLFPDVSAFVQERLKAGSSDLQAEFQTATERQLCLDVLRHTENNLSQTARILGISRTTLRTKLAALGITIDRVSSLDDDDR